MNTEKLVSQTKFNIIVSIITGVLLLLTGIIFSMFDLVPVKMTKAITGLSFIPFGFAFANFINLLRIKKSPQKMRTVIVSHNDERLVAIRNEADARAFRILQWLLFMVYMGYTLMVPNDIFEAVGWWIILIILFVSYILQGILYKVVSGNNAEH
jgi:predicted membrane chloride channel (bestrophin family)